MEVVDAMACVETEKAEYGTDTFRPAQDAAITIYKVTIANYPGPTAEETAAWLTAEPEQ